MSGQSSSSAGYGIGSAGSDDPCATLRLDRALEAPVPGVADELGVGALLSVVLEEGPPPVVALHTSSGALAGSIVPTVRLLECLRQAVPFTAEVTGVGGGGSVRVEVRAVP